MAAWSPSLAQWQRVPRFAPGPAAVSRFATPYLPFASRQLLGIPKGKLIELPLVSRNAIYDCAQDFNFLDLARVDRMQVFG